jgi:hypothetical protein
MAELEFRSLGAERYRCLLAAAGFSLADEYKDAGENHYFEAIKTSTDHSTIDR